MCRIDIWFLDQMLQIVEERLDLEAAGGPAALATADWRRVKRLGFSDAPARPSCGASTSPTVRGGANGRRRAADLQDGRHVRRRVRRRHAVPLLDVGGRERGAAVGPATRHHPRIGPEPHRPGHRVRLLLRPRQLRPARGGLRDRDDQLQPRDRVDRLRHVRPAVLRAAHGRGRAQRDRRRDRRRPGEWPRR